MKILDQLKKDHALILERVEDFEKSVDPTKPDIEKIEQMIVFIQEFADQYHHGCEETILFKELEKGGVLVHCNPVKQMLHEHQTGRNNVEQAVKALQEDDTSRAIESLFQYCELIKSHIFKEDNILFPMAKEALKSENLDIINAKMTDFDKSDLKTLGLKYYQKVSHV